MDLRSARADASWHPLTSLINFESSNADADIVLLPMIARRGRQYLSTLLHEVTHQWSARTTRLGFFLHRLAAEQALVWDRDRRAPLRLGPRGRNVIAAFAPLLEGLALFAQLDFEPPEDDPDLERAIPTPLTLVADLFEHRITAPDLSRTRLFRYVRDEARMDDVPDERPLPELLFLDGSSPSTSFYFVGYLYLKAVQAVWARLCPEMAAPSLFLPVALRCICHHPVIERALSGDVPAAEMAAAVHDRLVGVTAEQLDGIARRVRGDDPHFRELFDHWDVDRPFDLDGVGQEADPAHASAKQVLVTARRFFPVDENGDAADAASRPLVDWVRRFRNSSSVHLTGWTTGVVRSVSDDGVVVRRSDGKSRKIRFAWLSNLEEFHARPFAVEGAADWTLGDVVSANERHIVRALRDTGGCQVTLGTFVTLTQAVPGHAVWVDGSLRAVVPYGEAAADATEGTVIREGLRLAPEDRMAFAEAFVDGHDLRREIDTCAGVLLRTLVGDPEARRELFFSRFGPVLARRACLRDFRAWCGFSLKQPPPPAAALDALAALFDFPGFRHDGSPPLGPADLFPTFAPYW